MSELEQLSNQVEHLQVILNSGVATTKVWLSSEEAQIRLNCERSWLNENRNKIGFSKRGHKVWYKTSDIDEFIERTYNKPIKKA